MSTNPTNSELAKRLTAMADWFEHARATTNAADLRLAAHRLEAMSLFLADCEKFLTEWIPEYGGCDHAVNVCSCAEQQLLSKLRDALARGGAS